MIALDTNLLVYAHRGGAPQHAGAREAIERAAASGRGWGIAAPALAEWWAVVTHARALRRPSTSAEASAFVRALVLTAKMQIWSPGPGFGERLVELARGLDVCGPRVFDLQIGLCAIEHGATELWTHDRRFVAVPGLRVVDPLAG